MKNIFIVILILCCHTAASQSENIDSLYKELRTHLQEDTTRVKLLILLGNVEQHNHNLADSFTLKAFEISQKINWQMGVFYSCRQMGAFFLDRSQFVQAIDYLQKALKVAELMNNEKQAATIYNNMALIYMNLGELERALKNYRYFYDMCIKTKSEIGMGYAQNNIGQIFLKTNQIDSAVFYFEKCLAIGQKINNNDFILNSYLNLGAAYDIKKDFKRALEFFNQGIEKAKKVGDSIAYMGCLEGVAEANFYLKNYTTAISYCNDALLIAKKYNKLVNQRECYLMLSDMYNEKREFDKSLEAYKNFIQVRDSIINQEVKSEIVKKEMQYEFDKKEALLKSENDKKELIASAEIIRQRTVKNSAIVGATILLFAGFTSFAFYKRRRDALEQKKESDFMAQVSDTEMKALRAQMNPHFIFNSLNSIGDYISRNENKVADNYLSKFAKLMRKILENSEQKEISINDDLQALELYIQLESMRLDNKFTYEIKVDENIDIENTLIPPLLLQPFVENSIWHGIAHKQGAGKISIEIKKDGEMISCVVEDNGIGRQQSAMLKTETKVKKNLGMKITQARIDILNKIKKSNAVVELTDLVQGMRVEIKLPLLLSF